MDLSIKCVDLRKMIAINLTSARYLIYIINDYTQYIQLSKCIDSLDFKIYMNISMSKCYTLIICLFHIVFTKLILDRLV